MGPNIEKRLLSINVPNKLDNLVKCLHVGSGVLTPMVVKEWFSFVVQGLLQWFVLVCFAKGNLIGVANIHLTTRGLEREVLCLCAALWWSLRVLQSTHTAGLINRREADLMLPQVNPLEISVLSLAARNQGVGRKK